MGFITPVSYVVLRGVKGHTLAKPSLHFRIGDIHIGDYGIRYKTLKVEPTFTDVRLTLQEATGRTFTKTVHSDERLGYDAAGANDTFYMLPPTTPVGRDPHAAAFKLSEVSHG